MQMSQHIDAERQRIFQALAILVCLGEVLEELDLPHINPLCPDLQHVTDNLVHLLNDVATRLEPMVLGLPISMGHIEHSDLGAPHS